MIGTSFFTFFQGVTLRSTPPRCVARDGRCGVAGVWYSLPGAAWCGPSTPVGGPTHVPSAARCAWRARPTRTIALACLEAQSFGALACNGSLAELGGALGDAFRRCPDVAQ